jgi:lysophospholipase L1-like esterase
MRKGEPLMKKVITIYTEVIILVVALTISGTCTASYDPVKIMPLGDSITFGIGSTNYNGYRKPLYDKLTAAGYKFDFVGSQANGDFPDPSHEGHSGWHADGCSDPEKGNLLPNVYNWLEAAPDTDVILLHIGTNDITYGGQNANEVSDILDEIDRFSADIKVVLALIINRQTYSLETTQFNIDLNNMAQSRIASGDDIIVVNMESALNYETDMADNVHPNDAGYEKMADVWFDVADSYSPYFGASIPEPTTICLLGIGALSLIRRKKQA